MVRRRGRPRRSYAWLRMRKYALKYSHSVIPLQFKLLLPPMHILLDDELIIYDQAEVQIILECLAKGVPDEEIPHYLAYGKRVFRAYVQYGFISADKEVDLITQEFLLRGKDETVLNQIRARMYMKAMWRKGYWPSPAWSYDNVIGTIWLPEPKGTHGGNYDRFGIWLLQPYGYYDNRE